jgi:glycosyltransferase involved in cell wall biosynthesis
VHTIAGAPLVVTTHGEITADAHRLYEHPQARHALQHLLASSAAVTTPSDRVARDAAAVGLPLPPGHRVVPNGLDVATWQAVRPAGDEPVALAWGRHSVEKGFDRLPAAWQIVRESLPEARLVIAGSGSPGPPTGDHPDDGVTWSDASEPEEIRALLADARVVVVPSRSEAFGLVALEALAARRVVVYSADTGMAETIGPYGIPADADDPAALGAAIVRAFTGPRPDKPPADHFCSWSDVADAYLSIYRDVLSR